jgi:hypothetical protein
MLSTPAGTYLLVGGINVTGDIYNMAVDMENLVEETHTFGDSMEETTPVGIGKLTLSTGEGLYDDRLNGQLEAFRDAPTNATQLCMILLSGDDPGCPATMLDGIYTVKYNRGPKVSGLTMGKADHVVNARYRVEGLLLHGVSSVLVAGQSGEVSNGNTETAILETDIMFPEPAVDILTSDDGNNVVTTRLDHGFKVGDYVFIAGHVGSTPDINSTPGTAGTLIATVPNPKQFSLDGVTISAAGTVGTAKRAKCIPITSSNTSEVITCPINHGLSVGDKVFIVGHAGSDPDINTAAYGAGEEVLTVPSKTTFTITGPITTGGSGGALVRIGLASAYADLHVPELTLDGATNVIVTVRHSDESAANYTNAAAFTAVTTVDASERKTITDLKRFRALKWVFTGGPGANSTVQIVSAAEIKR